MAVSPDSLPVRLGPDPRTTSTCLAACEKADGTFPEHPDIVAADGELRLESNGFAAPLRGAYRTTNLV